MTLKQIAAYRYYTLLSEALQLNYLKNDDNFYVTYLAMVRTYEMKNQVVFDLRFEQ